MPLFAEIAKAAMEFGKKGVSEVVEHPSEAVDTTRPPTRNIGYALPEPLPVTPNEALRQYQVSSKVINKLLFDSKGDINKIGGITSIVNGHVSTYGHQIEAMDKLVNNTFNEDRVLYRGLSMTQDSINALKKSGEFSSDAYLSFSKARNVGGMFSRVMAAGKNSDRLPVIFELRGAAGKVKGVDLDQTLGSIDQLRENEVLLARGQKFKVKSVSQQSDPDYARDQFIHVVLTPEGGEEPLFLKRRLKADGPDQTVINVPFANGSEKQLPIDQDPTELVNKIRSTTDEELEKQYPGIDVNRLRSRIK